MGRVVNGEGGREGVWSHKNGKKGERMGGVCVKKGCVCEKGMCV